MIAVAARAPKGVQIPTKQTRKHIMKVFKTQMKSSSERLNVCMLVITYNQTLTDRYSQPLVAKSVSRGRMVQVCVKY